MVEKVLPELGGISSVTGVGALPSEGKGILGGTDAGDPTGATGGIDGKISGRKVLESPVRGGK